jgi:hypothetical protein
VLKSNDPQGEQQTMAGDYIVAWKRQAAGAWKVIQDMAAAFRVKFYLRCLLAKAFGESSAFSSATPLLHFSALTSVLCVIGRSAFDVRCSLVSKSKGTSKSKSFGIYSSFVIFPSSDLARRR